MLFEWTVLIVIYWQNSFAEEKLDTESQIQDQRDYTQTCSQVLHDDERILVVNCSEMKLTSLPDLPSTDLLIFLDLSKNNIDNLKVPQNFHGFSSVVKLKLTHSNITSVVDSIKHMNLENVDEIDLNYNVISHFPVNINLTLPKLKVLHMKGNQIHTITAHELQHLRGLKSVDLSSNYITEWDFPKMSNNNFSHQSTCILEFLDLSFNQISVLTEFSFSFTRQLRVLNVSFNGLFQIQERSFVYLQSLRVLDLSSNKLTVLPGNLFTKLNSLSYLYLSNNNLVSLPANVPMLNWFDISYNKISEIEESFNPTIYPHDVILLGGNPFICDCHLLWLKEFYDTRAFLLKFIEVDRDKFIPTCASPEPLEGDSWDDIGDELFTCQEIGSADVPEITTQNNENKAPAIHTEDDEGILDFKTLNIKADSVKLSWIVSSARSVSITYRRFGEKIKKEAALLPVTVNTFVVKHLSANTPYIVCIALTKDNSMSDTVDDEKCIEIITNKQENKNTDNTYLYMMLSKIGTFDVHVLLTFSIVCFLLVALMAYMYLASEKKEKTN